MRTWIGGLAIVLAIVLVALASMTAPKGAAAADNNKADTPQQAPAGLPDVIAKSIKDAFPKATITDSRTLKDGAANAYLVFVSDGDTRLSVKVNAIGIIVEVTTAVATAKEVPAVPTKAIDDAADGGKVVRYGKVEIRIEVKVVNGVTDIMKLAKPTVAYAAELSKDDQWCDVRVAADGTVLQAAKWQAKPSASEVPAIAPPPPAPAKSTNPGQPGGKRGGKRNKQ
jgi:hypothetical protein